MCMYVCVLNVHIFFNWTVYPRPIHKAHVYYNNTCVCIYIYMSVCMCVCVCTCVRARISYSRVRKPINLSGVNGRMKKKRYLFKLSAYKQRMDDLAVKFYIVCGYTSLIIYIYI